MKPWVMKSTCAHTSASLRGGRRLIRTRCALVTRLCRFREVTPGQLAELFAEFEHELFVGSSSAVPASVSTRHGLVGVSQRGDFHDPDRALTRSAVRAEASGNELVAI